MTPVASAPVAQISTPGLVKTYRQAQGKAETFSNSLSAIRRVEEDMNKADARASRWAKLGWLGSWTRTKSEKWSDEAQRLDMKRVSMEVEAEAARLETVFDVGDSDSQSWQRLGTAFEMLSGAERVWDETAWGASEHQKSSASHSVDRKPARLSIGPLPTVRPDVRALHFANANGPDLWIYPSLIAVGGVRDSPALIDLREVKLDFTHARFIESERVPGDAEQVGLTWRYVNKDGGPDRRFSNNPQYPVVLYGQIDLTSTGGLRERFLISDLSRAADFASSFENHSAFVRQGSF